MTEPPIWTREQLEIDRTKHYDFRNERMEEPLEDYLEAFDNIRATSRNCLKPPWICPNWNGTALDFDGPAFAGSISLSRGLPPISQDDLKVLAEATSLAKGRLQKQAGGRAPPD